MPPKTPQIIAIAAKCPKIDFHEGYYHLPEK
jgi:hypothetical protein